MPVVDQAGKSADVTYYWSYFFSIHFFVTGWIKMQELHGCYSSEKKGGFRQAPLNEQLLFVYLTQEFAVPPEKALQAPAASQYNPPAPEPPGP